MRRTRVAACRTMGPAPSGSRTKALWRTTIRTAMLDPIRVADGPSASTGTTGTADGSASLGDASRAVAHPYVGERSVGRGRVPEAHDRTIRACSISNSRNSGPDRERDRHGGLPTSRFQVEDPLVAAASSFASPARRAARTRPSTATRTFNFQTEIENGCADDVSRELRRLGPTPTGSRSGRTSSAPSTPNGRAAARHVHPVAAAHTASRVETGDKIGQFRQGLTGRFETPTCAPNNWPTNAVSRRSPRIFFRDIRLRERPAVRHAHHHGLRRPSWAREQRARARQVLRRASTSPAGTSSGTPRRVPTTSRIPGTASSYRKSLDNGDVWGHFINIVVFSVVGPRADDELCNFDEVGTCIAVLVE